MAMSLDKPAIGSTDWGDSINDNSKKIEDAFNGVDAIGPLKIGEDNWIGIGATKERIVFDGDNDTIKILDANVGIGTTPLAKLHVYASQIFSPIPNNKKINLLIRGGGTADTKNAVQGSLGFVATNRATAHCAIVQVLTSNDRDLSGLAFYIHPVDGGNTSMIERMRIAPDGVGIKTIAPSPNADLTLGEGRLCFKETTTPSGDADHGKIYTKSDNKLYFQDGAGVEHEVALV